MGSLLTKRIGLHAEFAFVTPPTTTTTTTTTITTTTTLCYILNQFHRFSF
jgi:hypothetical protein